MQIPKVENMISSNGNTVANQFIIRLNSIGTFFQSYNSIIAGKTPEGIVLDKYYWNYSKTTGKYRNIFLGETKKETEQNNLIEEYESLREKLDKFSLMKFLSGKYDSADCLLSIHAGQGGTEANDWAQILFRMYTMYCEKQGWKYNVQNMVKGTEAGISTVTISITGKYAYGNLKKETGTHRLVRISPFNAQGLRQTTFAGVEVLPMMAELDKEIDIPDKDIEFKAVLSGGPGGQSVNKTSSAVMITHIPTGITIHSSNERSQAQNRQNAMGILKAKLWRIKQEERVDEISQIKGDYKIAGWGNQIRNYILHPYKLVRDLRTNIESSDPESVLDGNLEKFIEAQIKLK